MEDDNDLTKIVDSCIGTKFASKWGRTIVNLAVKAVRTVYKRTGDNIEIDTKRYAKVEKIPGGMIEDCQVLDGVMFNKDITHCDMRRMIRNPRVVLLDCPLEYKKGESMTAMEFVDANDFKKALAMEEIEVKRMCAAILRMRPDVVITEKGVSDTAQHFLLKEGNCTVFRRLRKTDNNRVALSLIHI
jgi:T-complex protein 1 subunit gamma